MKDTATKERILDSAVEIMLEHGFHAVGINKLLSSVNIPKGSFYHWFKSKEHFGCELIDYYSEKENSKKRQLLQDTSLHANPAARIVSMFELVVTNFPKCGGKCPCLMQKLSDEITNFSDDMRISLAKGYDKIILTFKQTLDDAVEQGFLKNTLDTAAEAEFILDHWAGALQRSSINRDVKPIKSAIKIFQQRLIESHLN